MKPKDLAKLIDDGKITSRGDLKKLTRSERFSDVLEYVTKDSSRELLMTKPTRSLSGVTVIAVMCKPHDCPGKCVYCPKGSNAPQSYTGYEPATMRAIRNDYDSYKQVIDRLNQYTATGHDTTKIEVVVMGGTFLSTDISYQESFIRGLYQALNGTRTESISDLKKENETALHRCVALTFETRPDVCSDDDIKRMVSYGATRCELGLQSVYDDVLVRVNRGHDVSCVKDAVKRLKDAGLKVDLHIMIGLPGSSEERDINMFKILFSDEGLMPDGLKIYPCLVMSGTKLYGDWVSGDYAPLTDDSAVRIIGRGMELIPPYVRVKRVMRDIPVNQASAGPVKSNMHELALKVGECNCIRCRETGRSRVASDLSLHVFDYQASGGREFFISFEDFSVGALVGFARLRLGCEAYVRELHVYGVTTPVGAKAVSWQHRGYGAKLLSEAESIAKGNGYSQLRILSGVGVREYYYKQGYKLVGDYVVKKL